MSWVENKEIDWDKAKELLADSAWGGQYSNYGPVVRKAEEYYRAVLGIDEGKAIIYCTSGTTALHTAYLAIKNAISKKVHSPTVMTVPFNFPSCANGPIKKVVFTDLEDDYTFPLKRSASERYDIVIVPNFFGHVQDIEGIENSYSDKHIIYDNAASAYSFYKGSNVSNYGTASIISLHHTKPIGFGEGGLLIIDDEFEEQARRVINFGNHMVPGETWSSESSNYKPSDITAAFGMQYLTQPANDMRYMSRRYRDNYALLLGNLLADSTHPFKMFPTSVSLGNMMPSCLPIVSGDPGLNQIMYSNSEVKKYYKPLVENMENCNKLYSKIVCIPCHKDITDFNSLFGLVHTE